MLITFLSRPQQANGWKKAIDKEIPNRRSHDVYELVPRVPGQRILRLGWVYRLKKGGDGLVQADRTWNEEIDSHMESDVIHRDGAVFWVHDSVMTGSGKERYQYQVSYHRSRRGQMGARSAVEARPLCPDDLYLSATSVLGARWKLQGRDRVECQLFVVAN